MDFCMATYGRKRVPSAVLTTQNTKKTENEKEAKLCLLSLIQQSIKKNIKETPILIKGIVRNSIPGT